MTIAALLVAASSLAYADSPKLDAALRKQTHSGKRQRVIIRAVPGYRYAIRRALKACKHAIKNELASIDAITAEVRGDCLETLAANNFIDSIGKDVDVTGSGIVDSTAIPTNALRSTLGQSESATGDGVGIAIIDSGIAPLTAFKGRIVGFYDFTSGGIVAKTPSDEYGHGTHVAGLIGGYDPQYMGVAPMAHFLGLKVLGRDGKGRTSDVIRALEFAVANRERFQIHIINLSLGHPILAPAGQDALVQAVEAAVRAGLVVTVSAGNYGMNPETGETGYAGITSPGNSPSAITVGAVNTKGTVTRSDDAIAPYSSRGPTWYDGLAKPDVVAPGHGLISVTEAKSELYQDYTTLRLKIARNYYLKLSGTSMATAVTTGVIATVLQASASSSANLGVPPTHLSSNAVKAILQYTALPLPAVDELTQGVGAINAEGAVRFAWAATALAANPQIFDGNKQLLTPTSTIGGQTLDWAARISWGHTLVTGSGLSITSTWVTHMFWADHIIWGDNFDFGDNIIWGDNFDFGDNIIWGDNFDFGDNIIWGDHIDWADNIIWGDNIDFGDDIIWGDNFDFGDNIIWGDHIVSDDNVSTDSMPTLTILGAR